MVVLQSLMENRQIFHFYRDTTSPHPTPPLLQRLIMTGSKAVLGRNHSRINVGF